MTENELRKLSRIDLLEMLLEQRKENERLRAQLEQAREELSSRRILINNSGSIAEASLQLNGVFEAAQDACSQYMENIELLSSRQEEVCRRMEQETAEKCARMVEEAKRQSQAYWEDYMEKCRLFQERNPQFAVRRQNEKA